MREASLGGTDTTGKQSRVGAFGEAVEGPGGAVESFLSKGAELRRISRSCETIEKKPYL